MELDYKALGFKCGIEIHQQLNTRKKLFCRCPVGLTDDEPDARILRHMRPTLSELGEYDGTALMEFKTKKNVVYELFRDRTCSYEMDDTPPFPINQEALDIAIEIALLLNCYIVDEIHITRKQYLDGSIPTGFQRTAIVGVGGWIPYKKGKIRITQINLEEDACREIEDNGHKIVFRTDRLSTPLIEIITEADMKSPTEAMEVVEELARITRASGKVRRGIGSVRQDVNVSIEGGTRVEIKGVSRYEYIEALTANEAFRQKALLEIKDLLRTRGVTEKNIHSEKAFLDHIFASTGCSILKNALSAGHKIGAIKLCGFASILKHEVQPGIPFAQEFAGRVRVIACLDSKPNILHHGNLYDHGVSNEEWERMKTEMNVKHTDAMIITWGPEEDVNTALNEIKIRAVEATRGIPNDTRQAMPGGRTDFERVLPGPDRMYPDTDSTPVEITPARIARIRRDLPEQPWTREAKYLKMGISRDLARRLAIYPNQKLVDRIFRLPGISKSFAASTLIDTLRGLRRAGVAVEEISEGSILKIFQWLAAGHFEKEIMRKALERFAYFDYPSWKDFAKNLSLDIKVPPYKDLVKEAVKLHAKSCNGESNGTKHRFMMGKLMNPYKGLIEAQKVSKLLQREI